MTTGFYISGAAHALFIIVLLFGGIFANNRLSPVVVADVTVLSEEEFAALVPPGQAPEIATDAPEPVTPAVQPPPEVPAEDRAPERAEPSVTEEPDTPEPPPEAPELQPAPPADVVDTAPTFEPPEPSEGIAALTPDAAPAPAPRVAPDAAPPPPPDAEVAPEVVEELAPDPDAQSDVVEEEADAAAPEEAATEIVTEAEEDQELAPTTSPRPPVKPGRPTQTAAAESDSPNQPDDAATEAAIAAAVADAAASDSPTGPVGPPLTGSERDAFRISVQRCWVVDVGSEAANVTVVVGVSLNPDGTIMDGSLDMLEASGGSEQAVQTAFQAARRAVLRCGARGFDLPVDKYDHWRDIEMTFNPEGMRLR